ncbi:hypothetical protein EVAR_3529_1 [Eumeta japonica]|uniref:Uncharacterized protein n=1 Tax=Eumeta variegata TaxID=151549 RepID=A0A4C1SW49_EUMVA|nr:hypothetical protein EVAR_3529_1 [Eumeta japonica]
MAMGMTDVGGTRPAPEHVTSSIRNVVNSLITMTFRSAHSGLTWKARPLECSRPINGTDVYSGMDPDTRPFKAQDAQSEIKRLWVAYASAVG